MAKSQLSLIRTPYIRKPNIFVLDPIAIHHRISCDPNESTRNKTTCYDIEVEIDDPLKSLQNKFLLDSANQVEQSICQKTV